MSVSPVSSVSAASANPSHHFPGKNSAPRDDRAPYRLLKQAIDTIASVCDGAVEQDAVGFNASDAPLGHLLAFLSLEDWPPSALHRAWEVLRKYRDQLKAAGIVYEDIVEPPNPADDASRSERLVLLHQEGGFLVLFPSAARLARAFECLAGSEVREQPIRHRVLQPVPGSGKALLAFAGRYHFHLAPGVIERAWQLGAEPDQRVDIAADGTFWVYFPHNAAWNAEIKAIAGWRCSSRPRFHWILPATPRAVWGLQAFLERHPGFLVPAAVRQQMDMVAQGILLALEVEKDQ